jgi:replicative DNA helicase
MPDNSKTTSKRRTASGVSVAKVSELGHLQPQALDLEEAVIGACLIEKDAFGQVSDYLKPESFYDTKHQLIFRAISTLAAENNPVDILTVTEELRKMGKLEEAGGMLYVTELSGKVLSSAHIEYHAHVVAEKALARQLITFTSEIQKRAFDEGEDIKTLMQTAEGRLFELSKTNIKKDFVQIDPVLNEAYKLIEEAAHNPDGISGISSGFYQLDEITNGWQKSDLIIIAARPSMGKTAFVLSMAKNIAVDYRIPVAMFSLEMSNV